MSDTSTKRGWENAEFEDTSRKEKFLRLMGGGKKGSKDKNDADYNRDKEVCSAKPNVECEKAAADTGTQQDNAEKEEGLSVSSANAWEKVDMDNSRKNKFLRLMGAGKKEHTGKFVIGDQQEQRTREAGKESTKLEDGLEQLYNQGLGLKLSGATRRRVGFGFQEPPKEEKPPESAEKPPGDSSEEKRDEQRERRYDSRTEREHDRYDSRSERDRDRHQRDYRERDRNRDKYQYDRNRERSSDRRDEHRDRRRYDRRDEDRRHHRDRYSERGNDRDHYNCDRELGNDKSQINPQTGYRNTSGKQPNYKDAYRQSGNMTNQYGVQALQSPEQTGNAGTQYERQAMQPSHEQTGNVADTYGGQARHFHGQARNTTNQYGGQAMQPPNAQAGNTANQYGGQAVQSPFGQTGNIANQYTVQPPQFMQPINNPPPVHHITGAYSVQYQSGPQANTQGGYGTPSPANFQPPIGYTNPSQTGQHANSQQLQATNYQPISTGGNPPLPDFIKTTAPPPPPPHEPTTTPQSAQQVGGHYTSYAQPPPPSTASGQGTKKPFIGFVKSSDS